MAKKTLEELKKWVSSFEDSTRESRMLSERDRDYYDGAQWTDEEKARLSSRNQPCLVFNRIAPKIDFIQGYEMRSRTDPKAYPRTPAHEGAADAATQAIRYVCDAQNWPRKRSKTSNNMLVEGTGGWEVSVKTNRNKIDITIDIIPWDRIMYDYRSRMEDFSDAKWVGQVEWFDLEDAIEMYKGFPNSKQILEESAATSYGTSDETLEDKPVFSVWTDTSENRPRVRIAQIYYKVGGVDGNYYVAVFTGNNFLIPCQLSPFLDENGRHVSPIILQSTKVARDNMRYGMVRHLISPQDEINHRRSKLLHLLNVRQTLAEEGAVEDVRLMKQEMSRPDGHVVIRGNARFELIDHSDMIAGQSGLLAEAKAEIDAIGANAALTGHDPRQISGRAIQARQQGGSMELELVFDSLRDAQLRVYRAIWQRIKQFWRSEMWVRVTDDAENLKYVGLNRPITIAEVMQNNGVQMPPLESITPDMQMKLQQVISVENEVAELDVDIIIDESPDLITLAQEQFEILSKIPNMPLDLLIESSSLRNKRQILERIKTGGVTPEQQEQAAQQQQVAQQLQMQAAQLEFEQKSANIEKTRSESAKNITQARQNSVNSAQDLSSIGIRQQ